MMQRFIHTLVLLGWLLILPVTSASAEEFLLSQQTYEVLEKAQEKMAEGQYTQAERDLLTLLEDTAEGSYDRAVVLQTLGYVYSETEDYRRAAQRFEQALDLDSLPEDVTHNLRYNLAQLLIADGQYQAGIDRLNRWLQNETNPDNSVYVLLATAHYQIKQFTKTVEMIRTAISRSSVPREDWYRMQLSAHLEMQQYSAAISVLETLITRFDYNQTYWQQLAALYSRQDKQMTSLAVQVLASRLDTADADTVLRLTNLYRYLNIPYKAGQMLAKAMEDGVVASDAEQLKRLSDSWLAAREPDRAAEVLQSLRSLDESGETDLKLGRVYISQEQWQQAVDPLAVSLQKLSDDERGDAYLLSGMVQFNLDNLVGAETFLKQALQYKDQRNQASQWLRHVQQIIKAQAEPEPEPSEEDA